MNKLNASVEPWDDGLRGRLTAALRRAGLPLPRFALVADGAGTITIRELTEAEADDDELVKAMPAWAGPYSTRREAEWSAGVLNRYAESNRGEW